MAYRTAFGSIHHRPLGVFGAPARYVQGPGATWELGRELQRLGAVVDEQPDGLTIHPAPLRPARIQTYDDHRMAMSLSLVGLRSKGVCITNPACVRKTFPNYWVTLEDLVQTSR